MESIGHKCGVALVGDLENEKNVVRMCRDILFGVQHRGPLGAGLSFLQDGEEDADQRIQTLKGPGKIMNVLSDENLQKIGAVSSQALAQCRYATSGLLDVDYFQPYRSVHKNPIRNFTFGFNGNTAVYDEQLKFLLKQGITPRIEGDTEVMVQLIAESLRHHTKDMRLMFQRALGTLEGSFNVVMMNSKGNMYALRDRNGRHPLVYGQYGSLVAVASEDIAIREVWPDAKIRDIQPGQLLEINIQKKRAELHRLWKPQRKSCFVEKQYFADHRSRFDGGSVSNSRYEAGKVLGERNADWIEALKVKEGPDNLPIIVGVPFSANTAGRGLADTVNLPYIEAIRRNKNAGRTFMAATKEERRQKALEKYSYIAQFLKDRIVVLVDDSMVRGLTMSVVAEQLRLHGAKEVHLLLATPPFLAPCFDGIDFPTTVELIARKYSDGTLLEDGTLPREVLLNIAADPEVNVDSVHYLPVGKLPRVMGVKNAETICTSCVTGEYPTKGRERLFQLENVKSTELGYPLSTVPTSTTSPASTLPQK